VGRDAHKMPMIWGVRKAKYFLREIWTTRITLNWLRKLVFRRTRKLEEKMVFIGGKSRSVHFRFSIWIRLAGHRLICSLQTGSDGKQRLSLHLRKNFHGPKFPIYRSPPFCYFVKPSEFRADTALRDRVGFHISLELRKMFQAGMARFLRVHPVR
jgi:hypothetical protein